MNDETTNVEMLKCPHCGALNESGMGDGSPSSHMFWCDNCHKDFMWRVEIVPIYHSWVKGGSVE
jgi:hypothetical protein